MARTTSARSTRRGARSKTKTTASAKSTATRSRTAAKTSARAAASARRSTAKAAKTLAKTVRKAVKAVSNAKAVSRKTAAPAAAKGAVQTRLEDLEKKVSSLRTRYAELKSAVRDLVARLAPHGEGNGTGEAAHAAPARKRTAAARRSRTAQSMTAAASLLRHPLRNVRKMRLDLTGSGLISGAR
jgi:chromosome segregation ATPase